MFTDDPSAENEPMGGVRPVAADDGRVLREPESQSLTGTASRIDASQNDRSSARRWQ
jgi:hypothetical protein